MDTIQRTDQFHAWEISAAELGGHGLELGTVKQAQQRGLQHVGEMVPQSDLVAAQLLSLAVQKAPAHPGA